MGPHEAHALGYSSKVLELRTSLERFVDSIPLPHLVSCMVIALSVEPTGLLLARFLDTFDPGNALSFLFPSGFSWQSAAILALQVGFMFYIIHAVRYIRESFRALERDVSPLLSKGPEAYYQGAARISAFKPALLLGIAWAIGAATLALGDGGLFGLKLGPAEVAWSALQVLLASWVYGTILWVYISALWGIHEIGKQKLNLRPQD